MKKIAVFPGSFDPITIGHESIIKRAIPLFDKIYVAVGVNSYKTSLFTLEKRIEWLKKVFEDEPSIVVDSFSGLTVDYCKKVDAKYILRGLRTSADFEFERSVGQINKQIYENIETVFFLSAITHTPLNSSIVRDILKNNGDVSKFIPQKIQGLIKL
ncbi:MAG: pantetheine-phosphate adenylyltransferase [Bacteroidota bacterium]